MPKHIYESDFKYTPADKTGPDYLAKRFKRLERELKAKQTAQDAGADKTPENVRPLKRRAG